MKNKYRLLFRMNMLIPLFILHLFINTGLHAGPFLKIDKIDTESDFPRIKASVTVKDPDKGYLSGISEENLSLYEDGFLVNYTRVKALPGADNILYMVLDVDSSKSISAELLKELKKSAEDMFNQAEPGDMAALYRFNDEVLMMNNFTNNRAEIVKNLNKIERHGTKTLFYNALYDAIDTLKKTQVPRKAIVVFTDGKDEGSSIDIEDVIKFAREADIPIYCVTFNPQDRVKKLSRMCLLTGGKLFNSGKKDISSIYKTIINTVKSQYLIEYKTMLEADGKPHNIEVRLKYNELRDREEKSITYKKSSSAVKIQSPSITFINTENLIYAAIVIILLILFLFAGWHYISICRSKKETEPVTAPREPENRIKEETGELKEEEERITSNAWLVERDGINAGKKIQIQYQETSIGREKDNHIIVEDKSVSKKHAKIKVIKNAFYLFDLASDKGTFLNENKLLRPKLLYDWDEIRIGKKIYIFRISNIA